RQVLVRKHLRGETKFNWRGLEVNIIPADYDIMKTRTRKKFIKPKFSARVVIYPGAKVCTLIQVIKIIVGDLIVHFIDKK
ncbi:unnamed protein product, partial [marine sediment metagenome]